MFVAALDPDLLTVTVVEVALGISTELFQLVPFFKPDTFTVVGCNVQPVSS